MPPCAPTASMMRCTAPSSHSVAVGVLGEGVEGSGGGGWGGRAASIAGSSSSKSAVSGTPTKSRPCNCALNAYITKPGSGASTPGRSPLPGRGRGAGQGQQRDDFVRAIAEHDAMAFGQTGVARQRGLQVGQARVARVAVERQSAQALAERGL